MGMNRKRIYVLDTSVYLTSYKAIFSLGFHDIIIPIKVLEEIDKNKIRDGSVGFNARRFIKIVDDLRAKGKLSQGVRLAKGHGNVYAAKFDPATFPVSIGLDLEKSDNHIIGLACLLQQQNVNRKVILVSRDIHMRVVGDALGLTCEDYVSDQVVSDKGQIYTGFSKKLVDDQVVEDFYNGKNIFIDKDQMKLYMNQFLLLISNQNDKKTALAQFVGHEKPLKRPINKFYSQLTGIRTRNKEQDFAVDLLLDPKIALVTLNGSSGVGKTLMALSCGLEQVISPDPLYSRLVVTKPIQPVGRDIGFLPGSASEKLLPWLKPISDNLWSLLGDKNALDDYMDAGTIEIEAMTFIRGRSIANSFVLVEEAQNMSHHEIKTILTRVGNNSKIVLTGDIEQIDNLWLDESSNGLTHAIERFKNENIAGHITLIRGERSPIATLASKIL